MVPRGESSALSRPSLIGAVGLARGEPSGSGLGVVAVRHLGDAGSGSARGVPAATGRPGPARPGVGRRRRPGRRLPPGLRPPGHPSAASRNTCASPATAPTAGPGPADPPGRGCAAASAARGAPSTRTSRSCRSHRHRSIWCSPPTCWSTSPTPTGPVWRVLRPGGHHVFTVPYEEGTLFDDVRATVAPGGTVRLLTEPLYHIDPVRIDEGRSFSPSSAWRCWPTWPGWAWTPPSTGTGIPIGASSGPAWSSTPCGGVAPAAQVPGQPAAGASPHWRPTTPTCHDSPVAAIPDRVLMGPGPCNPYPEVTAALVHPVLGHLDPAFLAILDETCDRLRTALRDGQPLDPAAQRHRLGRHGGVLRQLRPARRPGGDRGERPVRGADVRGGGPPAAPTSSGWTPRGARPLDPERCWPPTPHPP